MAHLDLQDTLAALDALELRRYALRYGMISALWLAETADPAACAHNRGEAMATLQEDDRQLLCGDEGQAIVAQLETRKSQLDFFRAAQLRVMNHDQQEQLRIPAQLAGRIARLANEATDAWKRAKQKDCWDDFAPYLDQLVAASKEMALALNPKADPYDTLLDLFEHGTSRAFYDAFFDQLKATVVPLVAAVAKAPQLSNECVRGYFDPSVQWELSRDLATTEGVDPQKLVLGQTEHPFSDAIDSQHVFIATHIYPDDLLSNVFSMLHEGGHAMYEAGVDPAYDLTCLHGGTSMGMHEAQSRFFENLVGRDRAFAKPLLALLASHFPEQLASVTPDEFYLADNRVEPSLVRTEADELTYPPPHYGALRDREAALRRQPHRGPGARCLGGALPLLPGRRGARQPPRRPSGRPLVPGLLWLFPHLCPGQRLRRPVAACSQGVPGSRGHQLGGSARLWRPGSRARLAEGPHLALGPC